MGRHAAREAADISWVVFLKDGTDKGVVEESLRTLPGVRELRFVSKEEALETARKDAALSEGLALAGENPFPDLFEVKWDPFFLREDLLAHCAEKAFSWPGVERADYDRPRVERFALVQRLLQQMDLAFLSVTWAVCVLAVFLAGRLLFFPKGPLPAMDLALGFLAGSVGGAAAAGAAHALGMSFLWQVPAAGAAAGLLMGLGRGVCRE